MQTFDPEVVRGWPITGCGNFYYNKHCKGSSTDSKSCTCVRVDDPRMLPAPPNEEPLRLVGSDRGPSVSPDLVDNNPKTRQGSLKAPLHLVPPSAVFYLSMALKDGAKKYGAYNWREEPITTSVYIGAIQRHMLAFQDGEDLASDSGVEHLAHVMACCALLLDSKSLGILRDDRATAGAVQALMDEFHKSQVGA